MKLSNIIFYLIILLIPLTSASPISVEIKDFYSPKETMIIKISGSFQDNLNFKNIEFLRGHVKMPLEYGLTKISENYYLWVISPEEEGNYSINLKDISLFYSGENTINDYSFNFIVSGNISEYYISPGAILTESDFSIDLYSNLPDAIEIPTTYPSESNLQIYPGKNHLTFKISDFPSSGNYNITLGMYSVPIRISKEDQSFFEQQNVTINPERIFKVFAYNEQPTIIPISFKNNKETDIKDISLNYNSSFFSISPNSLERLKPLEIFNFNITILQKNQDIADYIKISFDKNTSFILPIELVFLPQDENLSVMPNISKGYTCKELSGTTCLSGEYCSGDVVNSTGGACCIGFCKSKDQTGNLSWVGYLLGVGIIVVSIFIYLKYKGIKADKTPLKTKLNKIKVN